MPCAFVTLPRFCLRPTECEIGWCLLSAENRALDGTFFSSTPRLSFLMRPPDAGAALVAGVWLCALLAASAVMRALAVALMPRLGATASLEPEQPMARAVGRRACGSRQRTGESRAASGL